MVNQPLRPAISGEGTLREVWKMMFFLNWVIFPRCIYKPPVFQTVWNKTRRRSVKDIDMSFGLHFASLGEGGPEVISLLLVAWILL